MTAKQNRKTFWYYFDTVVQHLNKIHPSSYIVTAATFVAIFFGYNFLDIKGIKNDVNSIRDEIVVARDSVMLITDTMQLVLKEYRNLPLTYDKFYEAFLNLQFWTIAREFSFNVDHKSLVEIETTLGIIAPFYGQIGEDIDKLPDKSRPKELIRAFNLLSTMIKKGRDIIRLNELRRQWDTDRVKRDSTVYRAMESLEDSLRAELGMIRIEALDRFQKDSAPVFAWTACQVDLIRYRQKLDTTEAILHGAQKIGQAGLEGCERSNGRSALWVAEFRKTLAYTYSWLAKKGDTPKRQKAELWHTADSLLFANIDEFLDWDPTIYNNLADYSSCLAVLKIEQGEADSAESYMSDASAYIERAISRDPLRASYRATKFELACFRYACFGNHDCDKAAGLRPDTTAADIVDLRTHLMTVLSLSYSWRRHRYLFGPEESGEPDSYMMRALKDRCPEVFLYLKRWADDYSEVYLKHTRQFRIP